MLCLAAGVSNLSRSLLRGPRDEQRRDSNNVDRRAYTDMHESCKTSHDPNFVVHVARETSATLLIRANRKTVLAI